MLHNNKRYMGTGLIRGNGICKIYGTADKEEF